MNFMSRLHQRAAKATKKAEVLEYLEAFEHVGLLFNGSPGMAELPFI